MPRQGLHLSTEQRLQQTLSPQQVRYFKILEMPEARVEEEVRRELDENPALEVAGSTDTDNIAETFGETAEEMQLADYRNEDDIPAYRLEARNHSADDRRFEPVAVENEGSLMDWLRSQLAMAGLDEAETAIGNYIIGNIDDNGYLTRTPDVMADDLTMVTGADISAADVRRVLDTIRGFDPAGVGAIDLRECLLLQLRRRRQSAVNDAAIEIVGHYFDLFSKKHYDRIVSATGMSMDTLREAIETIRSLNPKPGGEVGDDQSQERLRQVTPDFSVEPDPEGGLTVTLLSNLPELAVEKTFAADAPISTERRQHDDANAFIRRQRDDAQGFIRILKMRSQTLTRVMTAIVKLQRQFFLTGNDADLRPMILKDVSAITGDDQSVVSRATAGKYVATPWGIFPLKHFFNERFSAGDPATSSRGILAALRTLIESEDRSHPLSDEALSQELGKLGFDVARRTVTKYREQLGQPVARLRREI